MDSSYQPKGSDGDSMVISDGRRGIESRSIAEKVEKCAFIRVREGASPLPSALDPLPGSKRASDDEDEALKDDDSTAALVPSEIPEGSTVNPEKRKVSDYGSGQEEDEGGAIDESFRHQAKRVVGQGNNLLGSRYAPGRGGYALRGRFGGRAGRFTDNRPWKDVVTGHHQGESSRGPDKSPVSSPLANRSLSAQLNFVEGVNPEHPEIIDIEEEDVDEFSWEDCLYEQAEENEGWTQVGKDKGKAPMHNPSFSGKSDEPDPYLAVSPIFEPDCSMGKEVASGILKEGVQLVDPTPVTEVPLPATSSSGKDFVGLQG
ncbi:hypothetical protein U1Q18_046341 [Sarracenia purpurea var. burkii]